MICRLCGQEVKSLGFPIHVKNKHNINVKEYYDKYIKKENEGLCLECGKPTKFVNSTEGYKIYCSRKCANKNSVRLKKVKQTCIEHYGVDNPQKAKEIKEQIKKTNLDKYGVEYGFLTKEAREKCKQVLCSEETKSKRKNTNLERYGAEEIFKSETIKNKIKETNLKKYGAENIWASDYGKERIKQTNLKRYNCINSGGSKIVQKKIRTTKLNKIQEFCDKNDCIPITEVKVSYSIKDSIFHNKLLLFNDRYFVRKSDINEIINHTPQTNGQSVVENNIFEFIKSIYNGEIVRNTRSIIKPKELDIYIPEKKLAIEIDGIWYHSTNNFTSSDYHLLKTQACENLGIRLIHITDYEWTNYQDICKSIILNAFEQYNTIDAQDCIIKEITQDDANNFLNINHIQGIVIKSNYRLGLYYNNELVQLMCFGKSKIASIDAELLRVCTKMNTNVKDGFSTLLKKQPFDSLVTYVDRSKLDCSTYINFKVIKKLKPTCSFYKNGYKIDYINGISKADADRLIKNNWLQLYNCGYIQMEYRR